MHKRKVAKSSGKKNQKKRKDVVEEESGVSDDEYARSSDIGDIDLENELDEAENAPQRSNAAPPPSLSLSPHDQAPIVSALSVRSENVVDNFESLIAPLPFTRQWQMSDKDARICVFSFEAWKERFVEFNRLPMIRLDTEDEAVEEELKKRRKELCYLSSELFNIWSTGGCEREELKQRAAQKYSNTGEVSSLSLNIDPMAIAYVFFFGKCDRVQMNPTFIEKRMSNLNGYIMGMLELHRMYRMFETNRPYVRESVTKLSYVIMAIRNAHHMLQHACSLNICLDPSKSAGVEPSKKLTYLVENFIAVGEDDLDEMKPYQRYLLKLIEIGVQKRYRRYRDGVYEEVVTDQGYRTNFWRRVSDMKEFVSCNSSRENLDMWKLSTDGRHEGPAVEHLIAMTDPEFVQVTLDRHVFAFKNGVYFAAKRLFRKYSDGDMNWIEDTQFEKRKDVGRSIYSQAAVKATNAAANFFDVDFVDYGKIESRPEFKGKEGYMNIPTPVLTKVLEDQGIDLISQRWVFALIGRLFYSTGELDNWQVVLWILGRAGTGKSTLCRLVELFYQSSDVGVISNNIEEKFGLESIYDKLIFMAPEIKKDFKLTQAEFQSMISGEKMSVNRKFKVASSVLFDVPGMLAGNDMPNWMDSSNSIIRRIVLLNFLTRLKHVDGEIANKLAAEVGAIIYKCNEAYHDCLKEVDNGQIWDFLPPYFKETQNKLKAKTHSLYSFLQDNEVEFGADYVVRMDLLKTTYQNYCKGNSVRPNQWNEDLYSVPFQDYNLKIDTPQKIDIDGQTHTKLTVVRGCRLRVTTSVSITNQQSNAPQNMDIAMSKDGGQRTMEQAVPTPIINMN